MGQLTTEIFLREAKVSGAHVAYKGSSQAYTDIFRGEVLFMSDTPAAALPFVRAGEATCARRHRHRALGIIGGCADVRRGRNQ